MTERILLTDEYNQAHIDQALKAIRHGFVIAAPVENGYIYLTDAFSHDAVRTMHVMRGSENGVVAQVLIPSADRAEGIVREVSHELRKVMTHFWPGLISLNVKPQRGLTWDLGDGGALDRISVRVPGAAFVLALLQESGPLASASAAKVTRPSILNPNMIEDSPSLQLIFDGGPLPVGPASTVIESDLSGSRLIRVGAVSVDELTAVAPTLF